MGITVHGGGRRETVRGGEGRWGMACCIALVISAAKRLCLGPARATLLTGMIPYERLEAWRLAHELALAVYRTTKGYPKEELYGLTSQTRRAATSVPTNIVEGSARRGPREFRRYLDTARASLAELGYLLRLARDLQILPADACAELTNLLNRTGFLTWRLYKSMSDSANLHAHRLSPSLTVSPRRISAATSDTAPAAPFAGSSEVRPARG